VSEHRFTDVLGGQSGQRPAVVLPDEIAAALDADPAARQAFEALSYTQKREHVEAVQEARRPETRARRIAHAIEALNRGRAEA
jgi:uncharacterized protein YdeI (YjbR/CyaY-like superfamily)